MFFDSLKFKLIETIIDVHLYRSSNYQIGYCPFIYFAKYKLLGVLLNYDLIHFIDMKSHKIIYKYENLSTCHPSIIYNYKLDDEKYLVVENIRACFGFNSIIYLSDLKPKNTNYYDFNEKEIKLLNKCEDTHIRFACLSNSMKYFILQIDDNRIWFYSKK